MCNMHAISICEHMTDKKPWKALHVALAFLSLHFFSFCLSFACCELWQDKNILNALSSFSLLSNFIQEPFRLIFYRQRSNQRFGYVFVHYYSLSHKSETAFWEFVQLWKVPFVVQLRANVMLCNENTLHAYFRRKKPYTQITFVFMLENCSLTLGMHFAFYFFSEPDIFDLFWCQFAWHFKRTPIPFVLSTHGWLRHFKIKKAKTSYVALLKWVPPMFMCVASQSVNVEVNEGRQTKKVILSFFLN